MFLVGILSWWYGHGYKSRVSLMFERLASTSDFFSIGLLFTTLFAPFRQISAGSVGGSMAIQMRALGDQLISRFIGAIVRFFLMIVGIIVLAIQAMWSLVVLVLWALIPLLPVAGLIIAVIGWVPSW